MGLSNDLLNPNKKAMVVADCCTMIDEQATRKQGLSGLAVKTAYSAMLSVTDERVKNARSSIVRGSYKKLRGSAKTHVEEAVPHLARVIDKYAKV